MSTTTEALEHAEHAAHAGHGAHKPDWTGKAIGMTMAVLGVCLAFCAAVVGCERTEFTKTLIEQSKVNNEVQAQSTKFRMVVAQLEALRSVAPDEDEAKAVEDRIEKIGATGTKPENADLVALVRAAAREINQSVVQQVVPSSDTLARMTKLARKYQHERAAAEAWEKSFEPASKTHFEAAEGFERAQLAAEVGIVFASVALMLMSRLVWMGAIGIGATSVVFIVLTFLGMKKELHEAEHGIEEANKHFVEVQKQDDSEKEDEEILADMEKSLGIDTAAKPSHEKPGGGEKPPAPAHGH